MTDERPNPDLDDAFGVTRPPEQGATADARATDTLPEPAADPALAGVLSRLTAVLERMAERADAEPVPSGAEGTPAAGKANGDEAQERPQEARWERVGEMIARASAESIARVLGQTGAAGGGGLKPGGTAPVATPPKPDYSGGARRAWKWVKGSKLGRAVAPAAKRARESGPGRYVERALGRVREAVGNQAAGAAQLLTPAAGRVAKRAWAAVKDTGTGKAAAGVARRIAGSAAGRLLGKVATSKAGAAAGRIAGSVGGRAAGAIGGRLGGMFAGARLGAAAGPVGAVAGGIVGGLVGGGVGASGGGTGSAGFSGGATGALVGGAIGGPVGAAGGAVAGGVLGAAAGGAAAKLDEFKKQTEETSRKLMDFNRGFAQFSGLMARVAAIEEVKEISRGREKGDRLAASAEWLMESDQTRKENQKETDILWAKIDNYVAGIKNDLVALVNVPLNEIAGLINEGLEGQRKSTSTLAEAGAHPEREAIENQQAAEGRLDVRPDFAMGPLMWLGGG